MLTKKELVELNRQETIYYAPDTVTDLQIVHR